MNTGAQEDYIETFLSLKPYKVPTPEFEPDYVPSGFDSNKGNRAASANEFEQWTANRTTGFSLALFYMGWLFHWFTEFSSTKDTANPDLHKKAKAMMQRAASLPGFDSQLLRKALYERLQLDEGEIEKLESQLPIEASDWFESVGEKIKGKPEGSDSLQGLMSYAVYVQAIPALQTAYRDESIVRFDKEQAEYLTKCNYGADPLSWIRALRSLRAGTAPECNHLKGIASTQCGVFDIAKTLHPGYQALLLTEEKKRKERSENSSEDSDQ